MSIGMGGAMSDIVDETHLRPPLRSFHPEADPGQRYIMSSIGFVL